MMRYVKPPFDPPRPNDLAGQLAEAIRAAAADLASRKETGLGHVVAGCDGYPVVTIGDGTSCHDLAKASAGGALALTADLGGSRAVINANLGRSQSMNSGYQGTGLSSGAIPPALDAGAADVSLAPIDTTETIVIDAGGSADPLSDFLGATISGKVGANRFTAYGITLDSYGVMDQLLYWEDATAGDPPTVVTTSADLWQIEMLTPTRACGVDMIAGTLYFYEAGAEVGSYSIAAFDHVPDIYHPQKCNFFKVIPGTAGDEMIILGLYEQSPEGDMVGVAAWSLVHVTGLLTGSCAEPHVYQYTDWDNWIKVRIKLAMAPDGTAYVTGEVRRIVAAGSHNYFTGRRVLAKWEPPYTGALTTVSDDLNTDFYDALVHHPTSIGYLLMARHAGWAWTRLPGGEVAFGVGKTPLEAVAFFDNDGDLWTWVEDGGAVTYLQRHKTPYLSGPANEMQIDWAPSAYLFDGRHMSGDENVMFLVGTGGTPSGFRFVRAPFIDGATVIDVPAPGAYSIWWLTVPTVEFFDVAATFTFSSALQSVTPTGTHLEVVTRLSYQNTGADEAWGVVIEMPLPEGSTFVSATDGGYYASWDGVVRWHILSVAASASGYVEMTTVSG